MMKKFRPLDFVIFAVILFTAVFSIKKTANINGSTIIVQADGNTYEYSIEKDGIYQVQGPLGFTTFQVRNKQVHITDSPCQNKSCINQGWTSPLVCLPNRVIITIQDSGAFDAIAE